MKCAADADKTSGHLEGARAIRRAMRPHLLSVLLIASSAFLVGVLVSAPMRPHALAQDAGPADAGVDAGAPAAAASACNEQRPIDFLVRGNWVTKARMPREEIQRRRELAQQAVRYRTEHYGYFTGFGRPEWNEHTPMENSGPTRFFGLRVRINQRVHPALACVEASIRATCGDSPYTPQRLSGIRDRNTYHNGEISNHVFGIALDIDPTINTCCGCVPPWTDHPLCSQEAASIFDRMEMPECWVREFERYGFYWLGRDSLQDTMHFEFLADPDQITPAQGVEPIRLPPIEMPWPTPVRARAR